MGIVSCMRCSGDCEVRCVRRQLMLEAIANELPSGTIRFLSKVVAIEESGFSKIKIVRLDDGTTIKTKVIKNTTRRDVTCEISKLME